MHKLLPLVRSLLICGFAHLCLQPSARAGVVINEIFYHAPDDFDELEWIELHNPDDQATDLAGWRVTGGIEFQFPDKSAIPAHGFLVLCKEARLFAEFYEVQVAGEYKKAICNGGDTLQLADAAGKVVDRVTFKDADPWPASADGHSASLERITPGMAGDRPENWSASPLPEDEARPAGTPGRANASYSTNFPPVIRNLVLSPQHPLPGKPIKVSAVVEDADGVEIVELRYRLAQPGDPGEEQSIAMNSGAENSFSAEIPGQPAGSLIRVRVHAVDRQKAERIQPSPNDLRPAVSIYVQARPDAANIPLAQIIHTDPREFAEMERVRQRALRADTSPFANGDSQEQQELLDRGLDLRDAWFEWTVNQELDTVAHPAFRKVIAGKTIERNRLMEEALAATDAAALKKSVPTTVKAFQDSLVVDVKGALPMEKAAAFEHWYRERMHPREPDPADFLKQFLNLEAAWLALNTRFELSAAQLNDLKPILQAADRGRADQLPTFQKLMSGQGDFTALLAALGKVEAKLDADLKRSLSLRQRRFLQEWKGSQGSPIRPRLFEARPRAPRGSAAFVFTDQQTGETEVFDYLHITERSAGYKVHFQKDRPFKGMTAANIIFEYNDRFVLAEPLAFELYRRVGNAACRTDFVRLTLNGHVLGYHLLFEQVNNSFLRRNQLNTDGELYKILWYGRGIEGQHEKQDHPDRDHAALIKLVASLEAASGDAQWELIQKHFNVDQVATYFAVNMVLSHWDGFFNNYFTYHDRKGTGKWELYPWDQDKTWGFHDQSGDQVFFDMPVTFGMAGDRPPGGGPATMDPNSWWRPGGFFSKPLLANPEFRKRFLKRTRQILEETYTEQVFFPVIDAMAARLKPEIPICAQAIGEEPAVALARLDRNVASLKEHLVKRRKFLLEQDEIAKLAK